MDNNAQVNGPTVPVGANDLKGPMIPNGAAGLNEPINSDPSVGDKIFWFLKKHLIFIVIIVVLLVSLIVVMIGAASGWFTAGDTIEEGEPESITYYMVNGQLMSEEDGVAIPGSTNRYRADQLNDTLGTLNYGNYMSMKCRHGSNLSYEEFALGDVAACYIGFTYGLDSGDVNVDAAINHLIGLSFDLEASRGMKLKYIKFLRDGFDNQYLISVKDNEVSIKRKDDYLDSGISFEIGDFLVIGFEITDEFNSGDIAIKNIHLDTGGNNYVYEKVGEKIYSPIAQYDPDSINDLNAELLVSVDKEAYSINTSGSEHRLVFYIKEDGKFVEAKSESFGECNISLLEDYYKDKTFIIIESCKVASQDSRTGRSWSSTYIMYNYSGRKLAELSKIYFSNDEDVDMFVGKIKDSEEWKLYGKDGSVIKNVDSNAFVVRETEDVVGGAVLENITEL